jgi:hypothetical protein
LELNQAAREACGRIFFESRKKIFVVCATAHMMIEGCRRRALKRTHPSPRTCRTSACAARVRPDANAYEAFGAQCRKGRALKSRNTN